MPLIELDQLKIYTIYYPSGNYPNIAQRYEAYIARKTDLKGVQKLKFKSSVNKILHIRQL